MTSAAEWIGEHALMLWLLLILIGILGADLAWQRTQLWQRERDDGGRHRSALRRHAATWLMLCVLTLFASIAAAVKAAQPGELPRFDATLAQSLHDNMPPSELQVIALLTHLGSAALIAPAAILVVLLLLRYRERRLATIWALALGGVLPINGGLKQLFQRVRPLHGHGFIIEPGWSFPSGHAFGSMVFYGMLAYVLLRLLPPRFHRGMIAAAAGLIGMVGSSRILLQVHYFSDVLAGYAGGAAWLLLCIGLAEYGRQDKRRTPRAATPRPLP